MAGRKGTSGNGKDATPKVKVTRESLRQALVLFSYLRPYRGRFILSLIFIALSALSTSLFPFFLGKMIDAAAPGAAGGLSSGTGNLPFDFGLKEIQWSLNTCLLFIFIQLGLQTVFSFMRVYLLTEVGE